MIYAGIDFSMSSPSIAVGTDSNFEDCHIYFLSNVKKLERTYLNNITGSNIPKTFDSNEVRFDLISNWVMDILQRHRVSTVFLEGYALGAKGQVFQIGENTGVLKNKMFNSGIDIIVIEPTVIKKFFTGKGNAKKDQMYDSFYSKTNIQLLEVFDVKKKDSNPVSDIVDSYAILQCGLEEYRDKVLDEEN